MEDLHEKKNKKDKRKTRMTATFVSDEFEGVLVIIGIGSGILAGLGFWVVIEALTQGGSFEDIVSGLGMCVFFSLTARATVKRL